MIATVLIATMQCSDPLRPTEIFFHEPFKGPKIIVKGTYTIHKDGIDFDDLCRKRKNIYKFKLISLIS